MTTNSQTEIDFSEYLPESVINEMGKRPKTGKLLNQYKTKLTLTDQQKDVIIGCLLGDGSMGITREKPFFGIKFEQGIIHESYLMHLFLIMYPYCGSLPQRRWIDSQKTRQAVWFRTYRHSNFIHYFHLFYRILKDKTTGKISSKKYIPQNIDKYLTARVVAYWYMDDGTFNRARSFGKKQFLFSTQGFKKIECEILCQALLKNFNIETRIHKDKSYYRIYVRQESREIFKNLILPYIHPSMIYKLEES